MVHRPHRSCCGKCEGLAESEKLWGWGGVGRALQKGSGSAQASCSLKERALIELAVLGTLGLEAGHLAFANALQ